MGKAREASKKKVSKKNVNNKVVKKRRRATTASTEPLPSARELIDRVKYDPYDSFFECEKRPIETPNVMKVKNSQFSPGFLRRAGPANLFLSNF